MAVIVVAFKHIYKKNGKIAEVSPDGIIHYLNSNRRMDWRNQVDAINHLISDGWTWMKATEVNEKE